MGRRPVQASLRHMPKRAVCLFCTPAVHQTVAAWAQQAGVPCHARPSEMLTQQCGDDATHQGVVLQTHPFPYRRLEDVLAGEGSSCHPERQRRDDNKGDQSEPGRRATTPPPSQDDQANKPPLGVVLDGVVDPRNLGRAARCAFAFGARFLVIATDRCAGVTAVAEKAACGALAQLAVARVVNVRRALQQLQQVGFWCVGADERAQQPVWRTDLRQPCALVVGGEQKGLRPLVARACDELAGIPMRQADMDLNAADAAALLLYEAARQRALK